MSYKKDLIVVGFPRSANIYLNYALRFSYYTKEDPNPTYHTVRRLNSKPKILVPLRNPADCMASWHRYNQDRFELSDHIKYYIRFHTAVLEKPDSVILNFDSFTKNLQYLYVKVNEAYGIDPVAFPTDDKIKRSMILNQWQLNLPRDNSAELDAIKEQLKQTPDFDNCVQLYETLKER